MDALNRSIDRLSFLRSSSVPAATAPRTVWSFRPHVTFHTSGALGLQCSGSSTSTLNVVPTTPEFPITSWSKIIGFDVKMPSFFIFENHPPSSFSKNQRHTNNSRLNDCALARAFSSASLRTDVRAPRTSSVSASSDSVIATSSGSGAAGVERNFFIDPATRPTTV